MSAFYTMTNPNLINNKYSSTNDSAYLLQVRHLAIEKRVSGKEGWGVEFGRGVGSGCGCAGREAGEDFRFQTISQSPI